MGDLEKHAGGQVQSVSEVLTGPATYILLITELTIAGARLRSLSEQVRSTYRYVERCAGGVDRLADQMARLAVDRDTVAEHHDAAAVMRAALESAEAMAAATEDLSTLFTHTAEAHQADYGTVAAAAGAMTVPMADGEFYSNR